MIYYSKIGERSKKYSCIDELFLGNYTIIGRFKKKWKQSGNNALDQKLQNAPVLQLY